MAAITKGRSCLKYNTHGNENELAAKAIQGPSLPLEGVDYIHGSDSLPLGMLGVSDSIPDHVLKEDLQNAAGLLVDKTWKKANSTILAT